MFKKNSMFIRVSVPISIIMLIQALFVTFVLFANGTLETLNSSAEKFLIKNAENRRNTLETYMNSSRICLDELEADIDIEIEKYLRENNIKINNIIGNGEHEINLLYNLSDAMLDALHTVQTTGIFMYFSGDDVSENTKKFNGIYYRDTNLMLSLSDYSDILYIYGNDEIAKKHEIRMSDLWNERFTFSPNDYVAWHGFNSPIIAAKRNPELNGSYLSYWSQPYIISDAECITFTRPIRYEGQIIGIIGTEIQLDWLKRSFPSSDFDNTGMSGYMLISYEDGSLSEGANVNSVTGSSIRMSFGEQGRISFTQSAREELYTLTGKDGEKAQALLRPLRLYSENSVFNNEKWALVSVQFDELFFESSRNVMTGIIISSVAAFIAGIFLLAVTIRFSIRPLSALTAQIMNKNPNDIINAGKSSVREIALLCDTLNESRERSRKMEQLIAEERERYLIALESVTNTFTEYDVKADSFNIFFFDFDVEEQKTILSSKRIEEMTKAVASGSVCHPKDSEKFLTFLQAKLAEIEVRIIVEFVSEIKIEAQDNGYFWIKLKASYIYDDEGNIKRIISSAKNITDQKLTEKQKLEASRRDVTTGLFNRSWGLGLIRKIAFKTSSENYGVVIACLDGFEAVEAYYGRVFGAVVIRNICKELQTLQTDNEIFIRAENDLIVIYTSKNDIVSVTNLTSRISDAVRNAYKGENPDLNLRARIGVSLKKGDAEENYSYAELLKGAFDSAIYAFKKGTSQPVYFNNHPTVPSYFSVHRIKPVSIELEVSKETILTVVKEAFERSTDIPSVINALLGLIGELFGLYQVLICNYDSDFCTSKVEYQWNLRVISKFSDNVKKVRREDFNELKHLLNDENLFEFNTKNVAGFNKNFMELLCVNHDEKLSALACAEYENGINSGLFIFKDEDQCRKWTEAEKHALNEATGIISMQINIHKSHSASRAKSDFLSRMSHEIRTPMNGIIGMTDMAKEALSLMSGNTTRVEDYLNKIDFSSKHLLALINDILDMSKIESGMLKLINEQFSLKLLMETVEIMMRPQIEAKGIKLTANIKAYHSFVMGDEYRLRQVLVNFISNALKFTPESGEIKLSITELEQMNEDNGRFKFSVKDTGTGISKEDQPKIFKAFEQAAHNTGTHGGTGLGLAISSNIINVMGGKIEIDSDLGKGSEFHFTIMLKLAEEPESVNHTKKNVASSDDFKNEFKGKRILLAEDNEINTEIAVFILETSGLEVDTAADGREAVDKFLSAPENYYDVILMDIQMPNMDGLTATREIRKNESCPDARKIPIIAMTANAFDEDTKKSVDAGMNGHVAKPIDNQKLFSVLRGILK